MSIDKVCGVVLGAVLCAHLGACTAQLDPDEAGAQAEEGLAASRPPSFSGIYILTNPLTSAAVKIDPAAYKVPHVYGVVVRPVWNQVEPKDGVFDWSLVDAQIDLATKAGLYVSIAVEAGEYTPSWLFAAGAERLHFDVAPHGAGASRCVSVDLAPPWDGVFQDRWRGMVAGLASHLKQTRRMSRVAMVKVTGINDASEETRLPAQPAMVIPGVCTTTDAPKKWAGALYTPDLVVSSWRTIAHMFANHFPGIPIVDDVLVGNAFPPIDRNSQVVRVKDAPDVSQLIIDAGLATFPDVFAVQWNGLNETSVTPDVTDAAAASAYMGWQTNNWLGAAQHGAGCNGTGPADASECTPAGFLAILRNGAEQAGQNASYIEVFPYDAVTFPRAIATAARLLAP
jgi:hypothetical protein